MNTEAILAVIFSAVAAVAAIISLVVSLARKKSAGSASPADVETANRRLETSLAQRIEYTKTAILDASQQGTRGFVGILDPFLQRVEKNVDALAEKVDRELREMRDAAERNSSKINEELDKKLSLMGAEIREQLEKVRADNEKRLAEVRADNEKQLEKMRATVDEKLSETLEKRVEIAFKQVSDRLDSVQKGFGEMRELTAGVGNLNRIFSNVKTRGGWGEVALNSLLEQILTTEQYVAQFNLGRGGSREAVDFAIVMPGQAGEKVYLPIDAKFPLEDYQRLLDAGDKGDNAAVELARKALRMRVVSEARSIGEKYVKPPLTTNFAVMYLPNEGLYAEVLRDGALVSDIQSKYRVTVCGPTTVSALLNSLQLGFTTLKIQKKSGEIIQLMQKVRDDFGKFTELIERVRKQAQTVVNTVEDMENRNRLLTKKLDKLGDDVPEGYLGAGASGGIEPPSSGVGE